MASRKMMAPIDPDLNIQPLSSMDIAINPWQVAIKPTVNCMWSANHPLIRCLYVLLQARSAYSR
jgi:hypothetical protein